MFFNFQIIISCHKIQYEVGMKLLIVGNHTCGNRGDSAILRGILDSFHNLDDSLDIDILSRFPVSSEFLLQKKVINDDIYSYSKIPAFSVLSKLKKTIKKKIFYKIFMSKINGKGILRLFNLPLVYRKFISDMDKYDAIIQVGGSFFVDLYGPGQFDHSLCALLAKKPIYMIGHSVGPFNNDSYNEIANFVFKRVNALILRENVSFELMKTSEISMVNVKSGVDTAWLVDTKTDAVVSYPLNFWLHFLSAQDKTIAITFRELAPFDKRLGISQEEYENAFAFLINHLNDLGYTLLAISTCTGIDSYNKDDRMIALKIKKMVNKPLMFHIVMDELNDLELGQILAKCVLTVGTRLHSAIISMNFGTPAVAINYEHKSKGIMDQLGMSHLAVDVNHLVDHSIITVIDKILCDIPSVKSHLLKSLEGEKNKGRIINENILNQLIGKK